MTTPADELRAAAEKLRKLTAAVPSDLWGDRPWHAEECSDEALSNCPCIVAQGERREFDQPQIPMIQYVADAEGPDFAAYIAAMGPNVGAALAHLLDLEETYLVGAPENERLAHVRAALAVARAINGD